MRRHRTHAVIIGTLALVASTLGVTQAAGSAAADPQAGGKAAAAPVAAKAVTPKGFDDVSAIAGLSEPVGVAFAPDGTAFVGLKTGQIKSYDYNATAGTFEGVGTATDFADLSVPVNNYGDRGLTGITVDPQFPTRPFVYVNYTYNKDPGPTQGGAAVPRWGVPGVAYDECGLDDADEARLPGQTGGPKRGCPATIRVSRLTATRAATGWVMVPSSEVVLVQNGCTQFSSHASGDVAFGPDGKLYASAGDGASFLGQDYGQADRPTNSAAYPQGPACGDPDLEGGSLRAQDARTDGDPLSVDGTIFRLNPDVPLDPAATQADDWLVALGQRNPWRLTFRQNKEQLWSVDVGSSKFEEINQLLDAPSTGLINRGWPCFEGTTGVSTPNASWQALNLPICQALPVTQVQAPVFAYPTTNANRTATVPLTSGENCPSVSSSLSGVAFAQLGTDWPAAYQDALFFSDFLRGCIWRMEKNAQGQPDPASVRLFAQGAGSPVDVLTGPGGDLYYVDYGTFTATGYVVGSGGLHKLDYVGATKVSIKSSPKKVKVKVGKKRHKTPYATDVDPGTVLKLKAPRFFTKAGVRYVFKTWKRTKDLKALGLKKKQLRKKKLVLTVGTTDLKVKAVYKKVKPKKK